MEAEQEFSEKRGEFWLWLGLLLPTVIWAIQLQTNYLLIENACATGNYLPIHITSIVALILSFVGGVISWRSWMKTDGEWQSDTAGIVSRSRFMAILGVLTGSLFTLLIFAQWLPTLFGVPCDK